MSVVFGIDISHFQHGLSLAAVQRQGYEFVIAKATQGQGVHDPDFHTFREEATSLGLLFAAYHFLHSDSPARAQADNLAEVLAGHPSIPVMIDCEPTEGSSPTMADVTRFLAACAKRDLRVNILYLPRFHWDALGRPPLDDPDLPPVMQALYGRNRRGAGSVLYPGNKSLRWAEMGGTTPVLLQFGSRGRIDGFDRLRVDVDAFRGTRNELVASGLFSTRMGKKAVAPRKSVVTEKATPAKKTAAKKAVGVTAARSDDVPMSWRGRRMNAKTILMLQSAERDLGQRMVVTQGSFSKGVGPSKGTHDRGGVIDISVRGPGASIDKKLRALRRAGFAAWHRTPDQFRAEDHVPEHIHAVSLFDKHLSPSAKTQRESFLAVPPGNGLANHKADDGPPVPRPARPTLTRQTVRRRDILLGETNDSVGFLQDVLGLTPDRFFGSVETRPAVRKRFGWNGKTPMSERLFRELFPALVFELDATVDDDPAAAAAGGGHPAAKPALSPA